MTRPFLGMVAIMVFAVGGCRSTRESHYNGPPPSPRVQPTILQYIDADGFDVLFEVSLINQDPVIIVRTENEKPDWEGRLNAWIAAWSIGGKVDHLVVRGQIPLPAQLDSEFLREFRLLAFGVVDRAEELVKAGSAWWQEEHTRSRRVALLRPYNLRFHVGEDKKIQLILFHGDHAAQYREVMTTLTGAEERNWSRTVECSICSKLQEEACLPPMSRSRPILGFSER